MSDELRIRTAERSRRSLSRRRLLTGLLGGTALLAAETGSAVARRRKRRPDRDRDRDRDGGKAHCDASGGNHNEAHDDRHAKAGEGGRCKASADGGKVEVRGRR